MKLYDIIPSSLPFKKYLSLSKWNLVRIPYFIYYKSLLYQHAPLEQLIDSLPLPAVPPVVWVELKKIKLHGSLHYPPKGRLCMDGDWDNQLIYPLQSIFEVIPKSAKKWDLHETIRQMFIKGRHYSETPQYISMVEAVKNKAINPPQGCHTIDQVNRYFKRLMIAFNSMRTDGYLKQEDLGNSGVEEIRIHVTRNGKLVLGGGGNHRIRMAEILGIKLIPILIRGVHPQWVKHLCLGYNLPPHKAIYTWLSSEFSSERSNNLSNINCVKYEIR